MKSILTATTVRRCIAITAALALSACNGPVDRCSSASNPAECRMWQDSGGNIDDYLTGGMVGAAGAYLLMRNQQGQQYFAPNPGYHGPAVHMRSPILSPDRQLARARAKIERQRVELRRQQEANRRKNVDLRAARSDRKASAWRSSSSSSRPARRSRAK